MTNSKNLYQQTCEACQAGAPKVAEQEHPELLKQLPHWSVKNCEGVHQLEKQYNFKNFLEAMNFATEVGKLAEYEGHHPAILIEWGKVTVTWWTHKIGGLHKNDFIMAARTDQLEH